MPVAKAADTLGFDKRTLMSWIRSGKCPFGEYIREAGQERGTYFIYEPRFTTYITAADMRPICPYAQHPGHPVKGTVE